MPKQPGNSQGWALTVTLAMACSAPRDPGSAAADYVSDATYGGLTIEVDAVAGRSLDRGTVDFIIQELKPILDKPLGIRVEQAEPLEPSSSGAEHTLDELRSLERRHRDTQSRNDQASLYLLVIDGSYEGLSEGESVLGLAYSESAIVLFSDAAEEACNADMDGFDIDLQPPLCPISAAMVILHEVGHIIGLVGNGVPLSADHHDVENGNHCTNGKCLMHWRNNSSYITEFVKQRFEIDNEAFPLFGFDCQGDLDLLQRIKDRNN